MTQPETDLVRAPGDESSSVPPPPPPSSLLILLSLPPTEAQLPGVCNPPSPTHSPRSANGHNTCAYPTPIVKPKYELEVPNEVG